MKTQQIQTKPIPNNNYMLIRISFKIERKSVEKLAAGLKSQLNICVK